MSGDGWPAGFARIVLDEIDSTNAEAGRIAPTLREPTWILAHRQTAAHGRRGRAWQMAPGDFAATLAMRIAGTPAEAAMRSFVAAVALHETLAAVTGTPPAFAVKWPNDVLMNGGKVAGILLENTAVVGIDGAQSLAIGFGVNLASAPAAEAVDQGATRPVSVLGETGIVHQPELFLEKLAAAFARWEDRISMQGFPSTRDAWLSHAARLGEEITARTGTAEHRGIFETIDETGALILKTAEGRITIPAADVYF